MKNSTTQSVTKHLFLAVLFSIAILGCKKEENEISSEKKFEKAMLAAGFKKVDEKDIPAGITPYQLSEEQMKNFVDQGFKQVPTISSQTKPVTKDFDKSILSYKANLKTLSFEDEPGDGETDFGSVTRTGFTSIYYFNTVYMAVTVTFKKKKSMGSWVYPHTSHEVTGATAPNSGAGNSYTYFEESTYTASFDGVACSFTAQGKLYYKGSGVTYSKTQNVTAITNSLYPTTLNVSVSDN